MSLLKTKINLFEGVCGLVERSSIDLHILSPYIKVDALSTLLNNIRPGVKVTIITTWKKNDVGFGSSDLSVYPYSKQKGYRLLLNNRIHLKSILIDNMSQAYIGSANITGRGLSYETKYNFEIGTIVDRISVIDQSYYDRIIQDAFMVTDDYYNKIKKESEKLHMPTIDEDYNIDITPEQKDFLLTSLPMCNTVPEFFSLYSSKGSDNIDAVDFRSAEHDRRLYNIPVGLSEKEFLRVLKKEFFSHSFVTEYLRFIGPEKYFGKVSSWLHDKVTTVPTPKREEIKYFQDRLNKFITYLSDDYDTDVPGERSQRLFRIQR